MVDPEAKVIYPRLDLRNGETEVHKPLADHLVKTGFFEAVNNLL
jgi:hypothetical protein